MQVYLEKQIDFEFSFGTLNTEEAERPKDIKKKKVMLFIGKTFIAKEANISWGLVGLSSSSLSHLRGVRT